jgi:two-component system response regulator NreC
LSSASGFVSKSSVDRELIDAIRTVVRGEVYLTPHATKLLLQRYRVPESSERDARLRALSPREREVLSLTAEGYTASEIGLRLFRSPKTVEIYRARIARKLRLTRRRELVQFALRPGLLKSQ